MEHNLHMSLDRPRRVPLVGTLAAILLVTACTAGTGSSTPLASASVVPSDAPCCAPSAPPSETSEPSTVPTETAVPSDELVDDLGPFSCDSPLIGGTPGTFTNITDVRVGTHPGFDRVVLEYTDGVPEFALESAEPPFVQDASGLPLEVEGNAFWRLVMRGATKLSPEGGITYTGPTNFDPGFPQLVDLVEGGDFEAVSTWYLGLEADACVRVLSLSAPARLVIDVEH